MNKLIGLLVLLALSGCATLPPGGDVALPSAPPSEPYFFETETAPPEVISPNPKHISIPSIDAESDFIPTGLNPDGTLEVPPVEQPEQVSWYEGFSEPGESGRPAVILGHVDGGGRKGVFYDLKDVAIGDDINIDNLTFEVYKVETYPKDSFPGETVYTPSEQPELRLITCGGTFGGDRAGHYDDNVVVYARLASRHSE